MLTDYDPILSVRANAEKYGISRRQAKKRKEFYEANEEGTADSIESLLVSRGIDLSRVQITSSGFSERDPVTGSWTKVNWKAVREDLEIDPETLEGVFRGWEPRSGFEALEEGTMVVCAADLQVGKTSLLGGTVQTAERVRASFESAAQIAAERRPKTIVVADLGDIIENFCNTSEQAQTNDLSLTQQIKVAWRLIMEGIKLLAPHCEQLYYVAVPSNHGRVRSGPKAPASGPWDDYGLMIAATIKDVCEAHPNLSHVTVVTPHDLAESVALEVSGTWLGFVHGHQAGSAQKIGEWWKGQDHGRRNNMHLVDILFSGHWHSLNFYQSGNERWVIVAPTSDAGSGWFANLRGETSTPGMLTLFVRDGMWYDLKVV